MLIAEDITINGILTDLSLELKRGEILSILGPSGAGKSVVLKVLAGLWKPDRGRVLFEGHDLYKLSRARNREIFQKLSMTFQKSGLLDSMTVYENIDFPLREATGLKRASRKKKIEESLKQVGLSGTESLFPHELSGGMQKRLGIARALVLEPQCLLYDDPTAGLDPITSRQIIDLLLDAKKETEMTLILVTSEIDLAMMSADRIAFLHRGRFHFIGTSEETKRSKEPALYQFLHGLKEGPITELTSEEARNF
jgi:phospholipid/cholesterol/gamma-HCH transport system ATP-binding protein